MTPTIQQVFGGLNGMGRSGWPPIRSLRSRFFLQRTRSGHRCLVEGRLLKHCNECDSKGDAKKVGFDIINNFILLPVSEGVRGLTPVSRMDPIWNHVMTAGKARP